MPVADHAAYCEMFDRARKGRFAYPAVNVTSLTTANAVLRGLAEAGSDGIIQVSTGGAAFTSGSAVKYMVPGAVSIAEHVHRVAERYPVYVADLLNLRFPALERVSAYAGPRNLTARTIDELRMFRERKLDLLYLGTKRGTTSCSGGSGRA